jgi:hypothetical protein
VLYLILVLVVVWLVCMGVLAAWTLWFQGYIYSEPVDQIYWRAPAAGTAITVFLCLWVMLDYRAPGRYRELHEFSSTESQTYKYLWIPNSDGKETLYELRGGKHKASDGRGVPSRPQKIIASDKLDGEKHVFEPERDANRQFKVQKDQSLRYYEDGDQRKPYMVEGNPGQIEISHPGRRLMNLFLNLGFLAVWFLSLWLLLHFQWPHALGLAVVFWLVMLLFVLPQVLTKAEEVAKSRAAPKEAATQTMTGPDYSTSYARFGASQRSASVRVMLLRAA